MPSTLIFHLNKHGTQSFPWLTNSKMWSHARCPLLEWLDLFCLKEYTACMGGRQLYLSIMFDEYPSGSFFAICFGIQTMGTSFYFNHVFQWNCPFGMTTIDKRHFSVVTFLIDLTVSAFPKSWTAFFLCGGYLAICCSSLLITDFFSFQAQVSNETSAPHIQVPTKKTCSPPSNFHAWSSHSHIQTCVGPGLVPKPPIGTREGLIRKTTTTKRLIK